MQENNYCVYKHTSPSGKVYIGITSQEPERRWQNGFGYHHNKHFTNAINQYGWENFTHEILFTNLSKEEACQKEIELIEFYKSNQREFGYNNSHGGEINVDYHWSDEQKEKLSKAKKGSIPWNKGSKMSEETKRKISEVMKGRKHTEEAKRKIIESKQNITEETRKKLSESHKGRKPSEEHKRRISEAKLLTSKAYKEYKASGGTLMWNEFCKEYSKQTN